MSSLITKNFKVLFANQLYDLLDLTANSYLPTSRRSYMYAFIGKQLPWNAGTEVPVTPTESDAIINDYYRYGILAKQLSYNNASLVVDRNNWTANTKYNTYEANTNFYVLNSKDQVFKCLANNSSANSTSEPALSLSTTSLEEPYVLTADGYKWKYLYTVSSVQKQRFLTDDWMPVVNNKFVTAAAVEGGIDIVTITNSGNNYTNGALQNIITIDGDGTSAVLKANVTGGHVVNVIIQNRGSQYTYADLTFTDVAGGVGNNATATVSIAPHDGHGYDPVYELSASNLMFNVEFDQDESGILPTDNDFRQVVLLHNPDLYNTTNPATGTAYTLYTRITTSPGVGDFGADEVVFQGTTYETATFTAEVISFDTVENHLYVNNVRGTLSINSTIKGRDSGAIRVVNAIQNPTLDLYSGKILYITSKTPITRDDAQTERIRFILSF
jgi:hypothetical protein